MEAVREGRARPVATVRHRHLSQRPLAFVPLTTAGETGAPLGALVGTDRDAPRLLVVAQPRNRDLRFAFLAELAEEMLPYLEGYGDDVELEERKETDPETGKKVPVQVELCADAPQLLVPSGAGVAFVRLLGRSMRFRRTAEQDPETPFPAPARVPLLGRWLTHYGERSRVPGSSLLLSLTELLGRHWATGQSNLEDQHLGSLLAWIDPPEGVPGAEAALHTESARDG
ncbi:putative membrane protein, partial [Streptomyces himastatinicus ATCC 53653]